MTVPSSPRKEKRVLSGDVIHTDDLQKPGALHMAVIRSERAHAKLKEIVVEDALEQRGVHGVYTSDAVETRSIPTWLDLPGSDSKGSVNPDDDSVYQVNRDLHVPQRSVLASEKVRYVGEPIALVLAEDRYTASDALSLVHVTYGTETSVTNPIDAVADKSTRIHESILDNIAYDWEIGDERGTLRAIEDADHVATVDMTNQRISPAPIEPRAACASFDEEKSVLTVEMASQTPHQHRTLFAEVLGLEEDQIRVVSQNVGGGFGLKSKFNPEEILVAWCAIKHGKTVTWQETRSENLTTGTHGRGQHVHGKLAIANDGSILGLDVEAYADLGAYLSKAALIITTRAFGQVLSGQYTIPSIHARVIGAYTNTTPVDAYRGSGRPQAIALLEQLIDQSARHLDRDPASIRYQNFIPIDSFPYKTPVGSIYDSGAYKDALQVALEIADYDGLRREQNKRGEKRIGIGIGCFVEEAGTPHPGESKVYLDETGQIYAVCGTADQGQSHESTFASIVADVLCVEPDDITVVEGDTGTIAEGSGTFASRSVLMGGNSLVNSAKKAIEQARELAAFVFEANPDDVEFENGHFTLTGSTHRRLSIRELNELSYNMDELPSGVTRGLEGMSTFVTDTTFPFGAHVAVVEVCLKSGQVELQKYVAVDDCGIQINPTAVEGQIHGGIVQGIGQALYEGVKYDENGTPITSSLMDYALPRAKNVPELQIASTVTPSPTNSLGVKGTGESGIVGAPAAIINAVHDALYPLGIQNIQTPFTSDRIWTAIQNHSK